MVCLRFGQANLNDSVKLPRQSADHHSLSETTLR
jgi:hypothetical protein